MEISNVLRACRTSGLDGDAIARIASMFSSGGVKGATGAKVADAIQRLAKGTDDHGLPVHRLLPGLEVVDKILGDDGESAIGSDERLERRPLGLELLLSCLLLALGDLVKRLV